jgi:hypothetical protein
MRVKQKRDGGSRPNFYVTDRTLRLFPPQRRLAGVLPKWKTEENSSTERKRRDFLSENKDDSLLLKDYLVNRILGQHALAPLDSCNFHQ